ncbi:DUF4358 domain-containing protein [Paenibacillus arenilitoris]|uniref:DUF4358 domain-containing protein n=1 Tax=Paenibacillus arenilitoris TaxID=2772299 RepID=A0A927H523_9BACL|nr:DUF4358 domain-containing protein [Paenibacillus arenilitoris]MBD2869026.1 DUF4358 domain-containing protein [Paenibacillus arenilitoris]
MKQYVTILLAIAAMTGMLAACSGSGNGNGNGESLERLTAAEAGRRIMQTVSLPDMKQGDSEKLEKLYRIEAEVVEDFILYTASSNVKADELAVIKLKDEKDAELVLTNIGQHIEAQIAKFKDYRPEEYALVEKHVLKAKGRFVLFAVSMKADRIERAFDEALR